MPQRVKGCSVSAKLFTEDIMNLALSLLLFIASTECRPKTTEGGVVLNDLPSTVGGRPRIEQPYLRHALTSESRRSEGLDFCRKTAKCYPLKNTSVPNECLTTKLPYTQSSLELVSDSLSQEDVYVSVGK